MEYLPLAQIIQSLTSLYQTQHQAPLNLCKEQEQSIHSQLKAQE